MQVSQLIELDTHAVIGGGKARSFSMSDSAEFFTVLSDTLYRDKKRAVIRETICNAWDAHIMNGCTDKPVEIVLTDDELIIKDFGPGISDERIVPIYCVYGASTKVKDVNQTGGFGLGSKSPFAYSDHFTVASCFEGKKIVYAISRGGTATDGRPEIRQMVAVPTEETGITVTIPLREKGDRDVFSMMIRSVIRQGGMQATLNGSELQTVDYTEARKQGFCAIANRSYDLNESPVYVLYGTVLYPVSTTDREVTNAVNKLGGIVGSEFRTVLIAPPNSVGVTPSRESLSYSELTTTTIKRLLKRATNAIETQIVGAAKKLHIAQGNAMERYGRNEHLRGKLMIRSEYPTIIVDPRDIAARGYICQPSEFGIPQKQIHKWRYRGLMKSNRNTRRSLRRAAGAGVSFEYEQRQLDRRRLVKFVRKVGLLDQTMIYNDHETYRGSKRMRPIAAELYEPGHFDSTIYVAPNQRELTSMIVSNKSDPMDRSETYMAGLIVGQKPSDDLLAKIGAWAETFGYNIEEYDWDYVKPKPVRSVKQAEVYHSYDDYYMDDKAIVAPALESAKFFMIAGNHAGSIKIGMDDFSARLALKNLYPGLAVVTTKGEEEKLRKSGAINIIEELVQRLGAMEKSREVQYGLAIADKKLIGGGGLMNWQQELKNTALDLAVKHNDLARLIFPDRVKLGEKWELARKLIKIIRVFPINNQWLLWTLDNEPAPMKKKEDAKYCRYPFDAITSIESKGRETFKSLFCDKDHIEKRFGYLSMLVDSAWVSNYNTINDEKLLRLTSVIKHLQRFGSKSKLTSNNSNIALKEAA
jgi:hypothetical protein